MLETTSDHVVGPVDWICEIKLSQAIILLATYIYRQSCLCILIHCVRAPMLPSRNLRASPIAQSCFQGEYRKLSAGEWDEYYSREGPELV